MTKLFRITNLPDTGVPLEWERLLSAVFVRSADYGTRASTVLMRQRNGPGILVERSFGAGAGVASEVRLAFQCDKRLSENAAERALRSRFFLQAHIDWPTRQTC